MARQAVLALLAEPDADVAMRRAAGSRASVTIVREVGDVLRALRAMADQPAAILLEPRDARGRPTAGLVRQATVLFPGLPVIGYCLAGAPHAADICAFAMAGAHDLMLRNIDDGENALWPMIATAKEAGAAAAVLMTIAPRVSDALCSLMRCCLGMPVAARSVPALARIIGVHPRTLRNRCAAAGYPSPATLVTWSRLLLAGHYLATTGWTTEEVAHDLEFPSAGAMRTVFRRQVGCTPGTLRAGANPRRLADAFVAVCMPPLLAGPAHSGPLSASPGRAGTAAAAHAASPPARSAVGR